MQARVIRHGDIVVIQLSGRVDVETAEPFRKTCLNHLLSEKVVFDFLSLSFVGSSGIIAFLETMQEFARQNTVGFRLSAVGSEFRKIFAASELSTVEIHDSYQAAIAAFMRPAEPLSSHGISPAPLVAVSTLSTQIQSASLPSEAVLPQEQKVTEPLLQKTHSAI